MLTVSFRKWGSGPLVTSLHKLMCRSVGSLSVLRHVRFHFDEVCFWAWWSVASLLRSRDRFAAFGI